MRHVAPIALMLAALMLPSAAPARDQRLREVIYTPDAIIPVYGHRDYQAMIQFSDNERIENIAVGDSAAWQVTPNRRGNIVFVKPATSGKQTNLTVVTDRRTYLFALVPVRGGQAPTFSLRFVNPPEPLLTPAPPEGAPPPRVADAAAAPHLNFAWTSKGKRALWPSRVFDDGRSTYIAFAPSARLPAIFAVDADGGESPVNQVIQDGYFVIDQVPDALVLRAGKDSARLDRTAPTPPAMAAREEPR